MGVITLDCVDVNVAQGNTDENLHWAGSDGIG
jgi:hypothetical protein